MNLPTAFLIVSALSYFAFAVPLEPCTHQLSKPLEQALFFLMGTLLLVSLFCSWLRFILAVLYVGALTLNYLGYITWRVQWSSEPVAEVQMAMWLWDFLIALSLCLAEGPI